MSKEDVRKALKKRGQPLSLLSHHQNQLRHHLTSTPHLHLQQPPLSLEEVVALSYTEINLMHRAAKLASGDGIEQTMVAFAT